MSFPDIQPLASDHPLFQQRGFLQIFKKATVDYLRQGGPFIGAVLFPVLMIYGGAYGSLLAALNMARGEMPELLLGITLAGLILLFVGFWRLILYFATLNRSYANVLAGQPARCRETRKTLSKRYNPQLLWYVHILLFVQLIAVVGAWFLTLPLLFFVPEGLVNLIIQMLVYVPYVFVSMGFQVIAFGEPLPGPFGVIRQSAGIAAKRFWACLAALILCFLLTYYLIPGIVVSLAESSGAVTWFNQFHLDAIYHYLVALKANASQLPPESQTLLQQLSFFNKDLHAVSLDASHQLSQTLLTSVVNSLLLPWGTFVYALLYGDILACPSEG